jgi:hypothetical protein
MNFWMGFICGIGVCASCWLALTILAACMLAKGRIVEEEPRPAWERKVAAESFWSEFEEKEPK